MGTKDTLWDDDAIQFPRLLSEIMATQENLDIAELAISMDLDIADVHALFDRADDSWERAKTKERT